MFMFRLHPPVQPSIAASQGGRRLPGIEAPHAPRRICLSHAFARVLPSLLRVAGIPRVGPAKQPSRTYRQRGGGSRFRHPRLLPECHPLGRPPPALHGKVFPECLSRSIGRGLRVPTKTRRKRSMRFNGRSFDVWTIRKPLSATPKSARTSARLR